MPTPGGHPVQQHTDHAALFGALLTASFVIEDANGPWDRFTTILGICLLAILVGYFRSLTDYGPLWERHARRIAFFATAGLCLVLAVGWPVQWVLQGRYASPSCGSNCVADVIDNTYLAPSWLLFTGVASLIAGRLARRREREAIAEAPSAADDAQTTPTVVMELHLAVVQRPPHLAARLPARIRPRKLKQGKLSTTINAGIPGQILLVVEPLRTDTEG